VATVVGATVATVVGATVATVVGATVATVVGATVATVGVGTTAVSALARYPPPRSARDAARAPATDHCITRRRRDG
jgi:hypothetical protein